MKRFVQESDVEPPCCDSQCISKGNSEEQGQWDHLSPQNEQLTRPPAFASHCPAGMPVLFCTSVGEITLQTAAIHSKSPPALLE